MKKLQTVIATLFAILASNANAEKVEEVQSPNSKENIAFALQYLIDTKVVTPSPSGNGAQIDPKVLEQLKAEGLLDLKQSSSKPSCENF